MKLEKKHYYWIGGIIIAIAIILVVIYWKQISTKLGIGSTTRQYRVGGTTITPGFVGAVDSGGTNPAPRPAGNNTTNVVSRPGEVVCPDGSISTNGHCNDLYNKTISSTEKWIVKCKDSGSNICCFASTESGSIVSTIHCASYRKSDAEYIKDAKNEARLKGYIIQ